jgi:hypothetical protein
VYHGGSRAIRYSWSVRCARCAAEHPGKAAPWCAACERQYDAWGRRHAADIIWQAFSGATVAMLIGLGLPLLGVSPVIGVLGPLVGLATFGAARIWGTRRRRREFLASALPRAYLPDRT